MAKKLKLGKAIDRLEEIVLKLEREELELEDARRDVSGTSTWTSLTTRAMSRTMDARLAALSQRWP